MLRACYLLGNGIPFCLYDKPKRVHHDVFHPIHLLSTRMTRIIAISDTHGVDRMAVTIPDGDILLHAGDFSSYGHSNDTKYFLKWFGALPHKSKVLVAGNHDRMAFLEPKRFSDLFKQHVPGGHYLEDSEVTVDGLTIWGAPWTPTFMNWHFMADRGSAIKAHWDKIPDHIDVLVTHGPPFGILDMSNHWNEATGKKWDDHLGCADLMDAIKRVRPLLSVFGHIHGSGGQKYEEYHEDESKTICINASVMDEDYMPRHGATVIDL